MNWSYWEHKTWFSNVDFTIVGSGIVGLNCALRLQTRFPKAKIVVLEKGILPQGASTRNAGFACFGSVSELLSDLKNHSKEEVYDLVKKRFDGIQLLRQNLGDTALDFKQLGGYELFLKTNEALYYNCLDNLAELNKLLFPIFKSNTFESCRTSFGFKKVFDRQIINSFEGQLNTGSMMATLLKKVQGAGVMILNSVTVSEFSEHNDGVSIKTDQCEFDSARLLVATNGFARHLLDTDVRPARAQVMVTEPIKGLGIKGTFHLDEGYYYFRNINDRILLGGGRHLDVQTEETTKFGETVVVQTALEKLLKEVILPNQPFEIAQRWSGIMGVGQSKRPIIKSISDRVYCGVRLGGMGIAIGSSVGQELADLV